MKKILLLGLLSLGVSTSLLAAPPPNDLEVKAPPHSHKWVCTGGNVFGPTIGSHEVRVYENGIYKYKTCITNDFFAIEDYECSECGETESTREDWTNHSICK